VPLAARLGRRLRETQREREELLVRSAEASEDERRRIAADLHDGPVQDLAGISYSLSAAAEQDASPEVREALRDAAAGTREAMRRLRTLLVEIHPPNLRASGIDAALADLLAPLRARGLVTELDVEPGVTLGEEDERLVYRAAAEALRNVDRHARATRVAVALRESGTTVRLEVVDDGAGFAAEERSRRREDGHVGLALLEDLAGRAGATVAVRSTPGAGTTFALEMPRR
jgi:signal transduction histidine kinase